MNRLYTTAAALTVLAVSGKSGTWSTAPDFGPGASHLVSR